ncbi:MAG TPA: ABC transporter permease [Desertimonas sp.]|nr:ABC transporter permease [Desertimonas sp.]HET9665332.1 ABC transporter permease [Desertimonas sp.]
MSRGLRVHLALVYGFLFLPIAVLVVLSFNRSGLPTSWGGFTTKWYGELARNEEMREGLRNTVIVAVGATVVATVLGTLLAVGMQRYVRSRTVEVMILAPAVLPDIVLAVSLLTLYTFLGTTLGLRSVLLSHALFCMAFVTAIVRARLQSVDPSLEEAARDLGSSRLGSFLRITLPSLAPGIVAGALLAFTLSLDEFVIAFFTNGPTTPTLPQVIYSNVRFGVKPDVNALASVLLLVSTIAVLSAQRLTRLVR